jgi:hypothetical protein
MICIKRFKITDHLVVKAISGRQGDPRCPPAKKPRGPADRSGSGDSFLIGQTEFLEEL